jgi:hydroxylamine reductase
MDMFCYQCQEAAKGTGCTIAGVCGKKPETAGLQDLLLHVAKGVSLVRQTAKQQAIDVKNADHFVMESLFITITNANFDNDKITRQITQGIEIRESLKKQVTQKDWPSLANWNAKESDYIKLSNLIGVLSTENEDIRSLRELLIYGIKGMAAYAHHAWVQGYVDAGVIDFMHLGMVATTNNKLTAEELTALVLECGKFGVDVMALLDKANTESYGHPELTTVNLGVKNNPAILISGHDLKDMEELLKQTEGTGVDVYTHSEMLPANYYPAFKKYKHFVGNYGNAWWKQNEEFESFNGPILMTTNCIVPPKDSYKDRIYTTGAAGYAGIKHIADRTNGKTKDFSILVEHAKKCASPVEIEKGEIVGGFAHNQVMQLADKIVDAVKSGAIKKFFVMAGCDGRMKSRDYYTEFANELPKDTVILTAGCAKYRYNKLPLGDIGGIPRVLDAGQCNDSYSLAVTALKLKEIFELNDINELPIAYNIAWYEQKAIIVLLALLHLGVKNIHLGPTLPAFLSPNVANLLIETFGIGGTSSVEDDLAMFMGNDLVQAN